MSIGTVSNVLTGRRGVRSGKRVAILNAIEALGYVPDAVPETKNPLEFDPVEMRALFEAGREAVRRPDFWKSEPPRLEQTERIAGRS